MILFSLFSSPVLLITIALFTVTNISCATKQADNSSRVESIEEVSSMIKRNDGTFLVKCIDGSEEVRTSGEVLANNVCITRAGGGNAGTCVNKAYRGPFNSAQATELCKGASGDGPADCGITAYAGPLNIEQALKLCARTGTLGRGECVVKAYHGPFNIAQAIRLCQNAYSVKNADCGIEAYKTNNSEQAVEICK